MHYEDNQNRAVFPNEDFFTERHDDKSLQTFTGSIFLSIGKRIWLSKHFRLLSRNVIHVPALLSHVVRILVPL